MSRYALNPLRADEVQDLFHYGLRLVGGEWHGYESAFIGFHGSDREAIRGLRYFGVKGPAKTKAERRTLGFYALVLACVRAYELRIHPHTGEAPDHWTSNAEDIRPEGT